MNADSGLERYVGVRVLVAEHDRADRLVAEAMLTRRGLHVTVAHDGRDALEHLAAGSFALVLMECRLPGLDGYDTTRRLRQSELVGDRVPVIAVTAHADRELCLEAGMDDHVCKPLCQDALDALLRHWLTPLALSAEPAPEAPVLVAAAGALIDSTRLLDLSEQYGDFINELIEIFATSTPAVLATLCAAREGGDLVAIREAAHNLKGACQNVGATFMASVSRVLERDPSAACTEVARLEDALDPTVAQLRAIFASPVLDA